MKAVILAAGQGTRLMPLTKNTPKCLVKICESNCLGMQEAVLKRNGIDHISAVVGYLAESIVKSGLVSESFFNAEFKKTNMAYSLLRTGYSFRGSTIISYGDIVYTDEVLKTIIKTEGDIVVAIDRDWKSLWESRMSDIKSDVESLTVSNGRITSIGQTVSELDQIEGQYIGLCKLTERGAHVLSTLYNDIQKSLPCKKADNLFLTDLLQAAIDSGQIVTPAWINGGWLEFDTLSDIEAYNASSRAQKILKQVKK